MPPFSIDFLAAMSATDCAADDIPSNSRVIDLSLGPLPVGRASAKDGGRSAKISNLYIRNSHLSKAHARVWVEDGAVYLEDVGSTFGTIWNNNLLVPEKPVAIYTGDSIGFVVNRPSDVLKSLISKAQNGPMVLLDKLLNPRVQLQYVVHNVDLQKQTLVLLPVNDSTADASINLVIDINDVEDTPDVVSPASAGLGSGDAGNSDDEAPVEEKIVKESSFGEYDKTQDLCCVSVEDESGDECVVVIGEPDNEQLHSNEILNDHHAAGGAESSPEEDHISADDSHEEEEHISAENSQEEDHNSAEDSEEEEDHIYAVEYLNDDDEYSYELADEDDSIVPSGCHLPVAILASEDESDYDYENEEQLGDLEASHEDDGHIDAILGFQDYCVLRVKTLFDDSDEEDSFVPLQQECNERCECSDEYDSEVETPSSGSESECIFNSLHYSDDETVSDPEGSAYDCYDINLACLKLIPLMVAALAVPAETSRKRSYDEAELEDDDDKHEKPAKIKRTQPSTLRTVLKELGKGLFYVTGTIVALAAYGKHLENQ